VLADRELQGEIAKLLGLSSHLGPTLLKQLEPGDVFLQGVHEQFLDLIAPKFRKIWSFTEQLPTPLQSENNTMFVAKKTVRRFPHDQERERKETEMLNVTLDC
jgi:hypothetical protein